MPYSGLVKLNCSYGAPMGRRSRMKAEEGARFYLRRVRLDSGGYDAGGAYWGIGAPLWHAEAEDGSGESFYRASSRAAAKQAVAADFPGARFFR